VFVKINFSVYAMQYHVILLSEPQNYSSLALELYRSAGEVRVLALGSTRQSLLGSLADVTILVVRLAYHIDREILENAPRLNIIVSPTTGVDHISIRECEARGVSILTLQGETEFLSQITATAELAWGLLLSVIRYIPASSFSVQHGQWDRDIFCSHELQGKRLGILGLGRIGKMVARYGQAFRMRTLAFDPYQTSWECGVEQCGTLKTLLEQSDVLSVHLPLNEETRCMLGRRELSLLPDGAIFINTARGEIVDETALKDALLSGKLAGAGLDVVADEQQRTRISGIVSLAAELPQLVITPHIGGCTFESMRKTEVFMAKKLMHFLGVGALYCPVKLQGLTGQY
jgi:D-3-phosphoglycerate dehydrogenase